MTYLELQGWRDQVHELYCKALRAKQVANDENQRLREYVRSKWQEGTPPPDQGSSNGPRATEER